MTVKCDRCGCEISDEDSFTHFSQTLCEDCYIDIKNPAKPCDPWAVYLATRSRETAGLKDSEGLTELQKAIYKFVKSRGKATVEELKANFKITQGELEKQFATLRHCELIKGKKEGDRVYIVPFN